MDAERALRARSFLDGGCEGMLSALHPTISWAPNVLSIESRFPQRDVHLRGQGLVLVPSYFCWERPIMLRDQSRSPVLVYPVARDLHVASAADPEGLTFASKVEVVEQLGSEILLDVRVGNDSMVAAVDPTTRAKVTDTLRLAVNPERLHFFDTKTEQAI